MLVIAPGTTKTGQCRQCFFKATKAVVIGIVPRRIKDHRSGKKLRAGQATLTPLQRFAVIGQSPTHIERLAKHDRFMARNNGFKPQLRTHGVDSDRPFEQGPR